MKLSKDPSKSFTKPIVQVAVLVFNEEENIEPLFLKLVQIFERMRTPYEMTFVDDGSNDGTYETLKGLCTTDERVKTVALRRNLPEYAHRHLTESIPRLKC
jgi:glycosyltransferase involved in cell wall biosynthesis